MDKTLLVGFDAACWAYVDPLLRAGKMPVLRGLMEKGVRGTMHSTMPPWTPTAWSSIITGKNPGKHGVFDMLLKSPQTNDFVVANASLRKGTPFWNRLNARGIKTGMVNVPFTYPPEQVEGFLVCGFGTPNSAKEISYPPAVSEWIKDEFSGRFKPEIDTNILKAGTPLEVMAAEVDQQEKFIHIANELVKEYQVDILVINLMLPDHANHKMPTMDLVHEAYKKTDADLGALIEAFQPDDVMLFSDHGSSRLKGDFRLDHWLRDQGYLVTEQNTFAERSNTLNWLLLQYFRNTKGWTGYKEKISRFILKEFLLRMPARLSGFYWEKIEKFYPTAREYAFWSEKPDISRTKVFPGSVYSGLIYFNTGNLNQPAVVQADLRRELAIEIAEKLHKVRDPDTDEPLFSNIYFSEDLYTGNANIRSPELVLDAYDSEWNIRTKRYSFVPLSTVQTYFVIERSQKDFGWHSKDGLFVFSGKSFLKQPENQSANLEDIPATLLHLYGVPIPEDYDGTALKGLMVSEKGALESGVQEGDGLESEEFSFEPEDAEILTDHLRALGYLN